MMNSTFTYLQNGEHVKNITLKASLTMMIKNGEGYACDQIGNPLFIIVDESSDWYKPLISVNGFVVSTGYSGHTLEEGLEILKHFEQLFKLFDTEIKKDLK